MKRPGTRRLWLAALVALACISTAAVPAGVAQDDKVSTWADQVWSAALQGDRSSLEAQFTNLPTESIASDHLARLRESWEKRRSNRERAEKTRLEEREAALGELREHIDARHLEQALRSAVEVQTLSDDFDTALMNAEIQSVISWAEGEIPKVADEHDWLRAQELLFRLQTLYDDTAQLDKYEEYDQQLNRINRRVSLLATYAPKRLYDLRVERAVRLEEPELPQYNERLSEEWQDRIDEIDHRMLKVALRTAASEHIEASGWRPLLSGGLEALRLLATTADLAETFPKLSNQIAVDAWLKVLDDAEEKLKETPDGDLDNWYLSTLLDDLVVANEQTIGVPNEVIFKEFGDGATYHLDEFSEIIWPFQLHRFRQATQGNFIGVGILIRHNESNDIVVVHPLDGTPAYFGGIKPDDLIVEVNGESTVGWSTNDAVDRITGEPNTKVMLGLRREGHEDVIQVELTRDLIKLESVRGWWKEGLDQEGMPRWDWFVDPVTRIAYIKLTQFTEDTYNDLLKAWSEIDEQGGARGVVLDLRYNPGGLLTSAVDISNLFLRSGVIVTGEDKDGRRAWPDQRARRSRALLADIPTVVLVNKGSASASEIVSGCLQAHSRAVVVGDRTFGKGSVQTVHPTATNARLKLTTQYYRLPESEEDRQLDRKGRLVHKRPGATEWGVEPDVVVNMTPNQIIESLETRQKADLIPEDDNGNPDPDSADRPDISTLLTEGLDPQLETAVLLLQAMTLKNHEQELLAERHASRN